MNEAPVKQFVLLMLFHAQQDYATELRISPDAGAKHPIKYEVNGAWHDWAPHPPQMLPAIISEVGRLAGFTGDSFPRHGKIDTPYSGVHLLWKVEMADSRADCILTPVAE